MKERSNNGLSGDVTILFVEDDADDVILLSRALSRSDLSASARFVQNPVEVREYLLGTGKFSDRSLYPLPKIIMTDYRLCEGSARDILHLVRGSEQFKNIPVIVLSSSLPPHEVRAVLGAGARAFLEKPIDMEGFCKIFQAAMEFAKN